MLSSTYPLRFKRNWLNLPIVGYLETLVPFLKYLRISRRLLFTFRSLAALSSASPPKCPTHSYCTSYHFPLICALCWPRCGFQSPLRDFPFPKIPASALVCSANFAEVCSIGSLLCDFSPLSPQNVLFISLTHNSFSLLLLYPNCILFTLLYKTTLLSLPYLVSWTYFCTFKALWPHSR